MSTKSFSAAILTATLASFTFASPAAAQTQTCTGASISGLTWFDANNNGIQDTGEEPIPGVVVSIIVGEGTLLSTESDGSGHYQFCNLVDNAFYTVMATVPAGDQPSPANQTVDSSDNDGECCITEEGHPDQVYTQVELIGSNTTTDFGFWHEGSSSQPGTGTPGYWKNHPEAWPVPSITVGGRTYTRDQAIAMLSDVGSDKSLTMFSSLVPAMLNVIIGNDSSCVSDTIASANSWITTYPAGSKVKASGVAWKVGEPLHRTLDNYNNGMLCAPHRN